MEDVGIIVRRLTLQARALGALAARIRLDELGVQGDAAQWEHLSRVVECLDVGDLSELAPDRRASLSASIRTGLKQILELVEEPQRMGGWTHTDAALLQAQGSASADIARSIQRAGVGRSGARILDIGCGVAGLSIAFCTEFPDATVVGVDLWAPALELARRNVAVAGLDARIDVVETAIQDYRDDVGFDLIWLPAIFIPAVAIDDVLNTAFELIRPGGEIVVGAFNDSPDALTNALDALMTVRSGGSLLTATEIIAKVNGVGFADVHEIDRQWSPMRRLVTGKRAR